MTNKMLHLFRHIRADKLDAFDRIWPDISRDFENAKGKQLACLVMALAGLNYLDLQSYELNERVFFNDLTADLPGKNGTFKEYVIGFLECSFMDVAQERRNLRNYGLKRFFEK